jgi:Holliday junction resolvasome RuvABC endonuclease subunit
MTDDPTRGGILALDLARNTGWAYGTAGPGMDRPRSWGVWDLGSAARGGHGAVLASLSDWIGDAFRLYRPSLVVMEAPLPPQAQTHANTARLMLGYCAVVELLCYRWSIPLREQGAPEVRKRTIGRARLDKAEIVQWCRSQGLEISDHNAADAVVLWYFSAAARA